MVIESNGTAAPPPQELETFLPQDGKKKEFITKAKTVDIEALEYDPFLERKLEHPTSDMDTLTHLLKASLGTGILAMPKAFQSAGYAAGIFFTVLVAFVCTHCAYILVKASHILYKKTRTSTMSFPEVAQAAFESGPTSVRRYASAFRILILTSLFVTYFGTCAVYVVIIAENIQQVWDNIMYPPENSTSVTLEKSEIRIFIGVLWIPLVLLGLIRNLKFLAPVSMIANVFMGLGLIITMWFLKDVKEINTIVPVQDYTKWPMFFSITIFAMEAIGVVMPLENAMKTPKNMLGICGVMNKGMSGVTLVYILLGFLGYANYGDNVTANITISVNINDTLGKIVKVFIALAVFCTFGLQFYVCVEIAWNGIKERFAKNELIANMIMRAILVSLCVGLAVACPMIDPFIGIIGAFCFSILGLMTPAIIEIITLWDTGFGKYNWIIWKNVLIAIFSVLALVFGTKNAVEDLIKFFS